MPTLMMTKVKDSLDASMKKKAYAFFEKLTQDDTLPGLHIEPIKGSVDGRVRTGRVDDNFRAVMFKLTTQDDSVYVLCGVWPHDKANKIAEAISLTINPVSGVPEVAGVLDALRQAPASASHSVAPVERPAGPASAVSGDVTTGSGQVPPTGGSPSSEVRAAPAEGRTDAPAKKTAAVELGGVAPSWPAGLTLDVLIGELGINAKLASAAFAASTDLALTDVVEHADIEWQGLALLDLATGESVEHVKETYGLAPAVASAPAPAGPTQREISDEEVVETLKSDKARNSFFWIKDNDELRRIIEAGDFGAWRLFLHPEQRTYVERDFAGSFRLSGGAGTGKTVVAIHRAARLARANPQARILLTTYTVNLASDLKVSLRKLDESIPEQSALDQPGVYIKGIDAVAWAVIQRAGEAVAGAAEAVFGAPSVSVLKTTPLGAWSEAIRDSGAQLPSALATPTFMASEYELVVLPHKITSAMQYLRARRNGRGVSLDRAKRAEVWKVIEAYREKARDAGTTDFGEKAAIAAEWLRQSDAPLFDHVIVDEAQDLAPTRLQLLRALVAEGPNDLFICEDSHQRIYGQKVTLSHCGISIRGRSRRLTLNYRTTAQNLAWAMRVLNPGAFTDLEGAQEQHHYVSARSGPQPAEHSEASVSAELDRAANWVRRWMPDPEAESDAGRATAPEAIAILVRDKYKRENVVQGLADRGVSVRSVDREDVKAGLPLVMTMHRAKGLEFTHVLLFGVQDGSIPVSLKDYSTSEEDTKDAMLRERSLLYVAATRARDVLAVSWAGEKSPLL